MKIRVLTVSLILFLFNACVESQNSESEFVEVDGINFTLNGEAFEYVGTNFWYGAYLGQPGEEGNRERLINELDFLT